MSSAPALVVERDAALRRLMRDAVQRAGYRVIECSNPLQLKVELRSPDVTDGHSALLVLSTDIAKQCTEELSMLLRARARAGMPKLEFAFTCEFGAPQLPPSLGAYDLVGMLEKPFSLDELEHIAQRCRSRGAWTDGARNE